MPKIQYNFKIKDFGDGNYELAVFSSVYHRKDEDIEEHKENGLDNYLNEDCNDDLQVKDDTERTTHSIQVSLNRTVNTIYDYTRSNVWEWFFTITFDGERINRYNLDECKKVLAKWFNNQKLRVSPNLKYLAVPEKHKRGGYHFHALVSGFDESFIVSAINKRTGKPIFTKDGKLVYNVSNCKLGFTTATRIESTEKASSYICKYVTKDLIAESMYKQRFLASKGLGKPEVTYYLLKDLAKANVGGLDMFPCIRDFAESVNAECLHTKQHSYIDPFGKEQTVVYVQLKEKEMEV